MKPLLPIFLVVSFFSPLSIATANAPDSDLLGVFFDESGGQASFETTEPSEVVPFHIILLEPSHGESIYAWECILEGRTGDGPAAMFGWDLAGEGFNAAQDPRFLVMMTSPLPPAAAVVLASGEVLVPDSETEILFYLHPFDPPSLQNPPYGGYPVTTPLYAYGDELYQPLGWTSGCEAEPVARINDDGVGPVWGLGELPSEIVFEPPLAGETATVNLFVENVGEVPISGQMAISGDGFSYRHVATGIPWTDDQQWFRIDAGDQLQVVIRVVSAMDEEYSGALDISLCGETTPIVLVKPEAFYSCTIEPPVLDFGEVDLYSPDPAIMTADVVNNGTVGSIFSVYEDCPDFSGEIDNYIPPGDSGTLLVTFDPSGIGPQECVVSISGGLCELVCTAVVVVEGPPRCDVTPPGWDFGVGLVGMPVQQAFEVQNAGGQQLEGQVRIPESSSCFTMVEGTEPFSLACGETHHFTVEFDPVEEGPQECNISVSADCTDVELLGLGLVPEEGCWYYQAVDGPIVGSVDTPGSAGGVAVSDSCAYVADGESGLQVIDITNPANPQLVGGVDTSWASSVAIGGSHAYVADGHAGLQVIDIMNPQSPQIVGSVDTPGEARDVAVAGSYAYVADYNSGLQVIDITDTSSPQIVGSYDTHFAVVVVVRDSFAYVLSWVSGLQVIDITDPTSPQLVGSGGDVSDMETGLAVAGSYAYVTAESMYPDEEQQGLWVFDITDPTSPQYVSHMEMHNDGAADVAVAGSFAYVTSSPGLKVVDITDPTSPQLVGEVDTQSWTRGVAFAEPFVYLASVNAGLNIVWHQCDDVVAIEGDPEETNPDEEVPSAGLRLAVHPNPFNPRTTISFTLDRPQNVELCIFDMTGKRIAVLADRLFQAGTHSLNWEGRDLQGNAVASGSYLLRMVGDEGVATEKMMLIR